MDFSAYESWRSSREGELWICALDDVRHFQTFSVSYFHLNCIFSANIPNNDIAKADLIVPYLQPFPPKGTGYHRHIFILYKQDKKLDFSEYKVVNSTGLDKRTFNTFEFYRKFQDIITPAGLAFFQSDWDKSLTDFYHNTLGEFLNLFLSKSFFLQKFIFHVTKGMKEPIFEYDFPKAYLKDQTYFPLRQPFNLYMDKYRDPKQVHKEYLERKLAKTHPFEGPEKPLRFPNAHPLRNIPSWLKTEIKKDRLRQGRINDI